VTVGDLTEPELIARIARRLPPSPDWMPVGIGDDAAVVGPERNRLEALTVDALVEGVHFDRAFTPPEAIGHRALAVNLSDLAAMGAAPRLALLSLAMPPGWPVDEFDRMIGGFVALAARHRLHLAGGNLTRSPGPLVVNVTLTGTIKPRRVLRRVGAKAGDALFVTGSLGAATAGLQMLGDSPPPDDLAANPCIQRYLFPEPRVRCGLLLGRNRAATSCIDLSDGLADGVRRIAEANGIGIVVDGASLPVEPAAREWFERGGADALKSAVLGGDDYELLFTARPRALGRVTAVCRGGGPVTRIGVCTTERRVVLRADGSDWPIPPGYSHFR
jgi:thiamine-monophosphate kinase